MARLVREAADWLRTSKDTDQWARPWPNRPAHRERILNDLIKGKTWIVWDGPVAAATITVDTDEPLDLHERPIWPAHKRRQPAVYVRRVVVSRNYARIGLGAGLLDWAADVAEKSPRGGAHPHRCVDHQPGAARLLRRAGFQPERGQRPGRARRLSRLRRSSNATCTDPPRTTANCSQNEAWATAGSADRARPRAYDNPIIICWPVRPVTVVPACLRSGWQNLLSCLRTARHVAEFLLDDIQCRKPPPRGLVPGYQHSGRRGRFPAFSPHPDLVA